MTITSQNKTPLYRKCLEMGAKMTDFHGWLLPLQFSSIIEECRAVRKTAGLFDISHMGKAEVIGEHALQLIQSLSVNDISKIPEGKAIYTALVNDKGGIIDDMVVYHAGKRRYFICANAANVEKDVSWIAEFASQYPDVEVRNLTQQYGLLAIQGPNSEAILKSLAGPRAAGLEYFHFMFAPIAGKNILVSRTGYTGEDGFELYCDWRDTETIWDAIMAKGKQWGIKPIGLGARDLLRLEMGYLLHGQDMDSSVTPYEAGLGWIVKLDKPGGMIAQEALAAKKADPSGRIMAGFEVEERGGIPRHGFAILAEGRIIGEVTSGGMSPNSGKTVGMGYVLREFSAPGTSIQIDVRGKAVAARIVKRPFLTPRTKKPKIAPAAQDAKTTNAEEEK